MRKYLNYVLANACDFLINQAIIKCLNDESSDSLDLMINQSKIKCLNYDSSDSLDLMINHSNPLITKIMVKTTISENFKEIPI